MDAKRTTVYGCAALIPIVLMGSVVALRLHIKGTLSPDLPVLFAIAALCGALLCGLLRMADVQAKRRAASLLKCAAALENLGQCAQKASDALGEVSRLRELQAALEERRGKSFQ